LHRPRNVATPGPAQPTGNLACSRDRDGEGESEGVGSEPDREGAGPVPDGEGVRRARDGEGVGEDGTGAGERDGAGLGATVGDVAGAWWTGWPPGMAANRMPAVMTPAAASAAAPSRTSRRRRRLSPRRMTSAGDSGRASRAAWSATCRSSSPSSGTGHLLSAAAAPSRGAASRRCGARAARPRASRALTVPAGTPVSAPIWATVRSHRW